MLNIIIYDNKFVQDSITAVNMALAKSDIEYNLSKFDKLDDELNKIIDNKSSSKIYIINIDCLLGMEIASRIRENDFDSIIIFISECRKCQAAVFNNKLMALDFIYRDKNYNLRLINDIKLSLKIIYRDRTFVFKYNHVVYRIPYADIIYIEKEPSIKRCIVHTFREDYYVSNSIEKIRELLGGYFFRTHQACIVNVNNIRKIDLSNNEIMFNNGTFTTLLSEKMKKDIKLFFNI